MTDGQSASLSWNKAPTWGPIPNFYYCQTVAGLLTRGRVCRLQLLLAFASAVILGSESQGTYNHILLLHSRFPQPGWPDPRIYIPQEQVGPVIPQELCLLLHIENVVRHGPNRKHRVHQLYCCVCICYRGNVFTERMPRNVSEDTESKTML
jgi:hypothetical protein